MALNLRRVDTKLMKIHKSTATILIVSGALHGILSFSNFYEFKIIAFIIGTISLLSCIASAACFYMRKRLKHIKPWILLHRFFAVIALVTFTGHIALTR